MNVHSNGPTWSGQDPNELGELFGLLATEPLDPTFTSFVHRDPKFPGEVQAHGNFLHVSHVFDIRGTEEELAPLLRAIRRNRESAAYIEARDSKGRLTFEFGERVAPNEAKGHATGQGSLFGNPAVPA